MKTVVISQPMYFPWVGMLEQVRLADVWVHLGDALFSMGGFFNRVQLKSAEGTPWLTVPLAEHKLGQLLNETQMAKHDWRRKQLATLRQAYAAAPYVEDQREAFAGQLFGLRPLVEGDEHCPGAPRKVVLVQEPGAGVTGGRAGPLDPTFVVQALV